MLFTIYIFLRLFCNGFNRAFALITTTTATKPFCEKTQFTIARNLGTLAVVLLGTLAVRAFALFTRLCTVGTIVLGNRATRHY